MKYKMGNKTFKIQSGKISSGQLELETSDGFGSFAKCEYFIIHYVVVRTSKCRLLMAEFVPF